MKDHRRPRPQTTRAPRIPAWIAVGAAALLVLSASGCDRTRPYVPPGAPSPTQGTVPATAAPAQPSVPAAQAEAPVRTDQGWRFTYLGPQANAVALAGTFNDWSTSADPLTKGTTGVWSVVKPLDPGTYQYKFVVNGTEWKADPANPNTTDDGYGGKNSVVTVQ